MRLRTLTGITFIALLFATNFGKAQDTQFGVKGGPNFHNTYGQENFDPSMRVGFHLGGFVQFGLSDDLFLRPEILYSLEGNRFTFEFGGESSSVTNSLNYLAIPVMARYSLDGLYFEGGPSIGLFLGQRSRSDNQDEPSDLTSEGYNSLELALELGGGYELENGLDIGLRLDLGLSGINELDDDAPDDVDRTKNIGFRLSGAYAF